MTDIVYFLLVLDVRRNALEQSRQFDDVDTALAAYAEAEQQYLGRGYEVVLVGAESIEAVMLTHGSYFTSTKSPPHAGLDFSLS